MKSLFAAMLLLLLSISSQVSAQVVSADSAHVDSLIISLNVLNPQEALGAPDFGYAHIGSGIATIDLAVKSTLNPSKVFQINPGAVVRVYGELDASVDSSAAYVQFIRVNNFGSILYSSRFYLLGPGVNTITLPDSAYDYMEFTMTGGGTSTGSQGYLLDAVTIVQDYAKLAVERTLTIASAIRSIYPNPVTASTVTFQSELPRSGNLVYEFYSLTGESAVAISAGEVNSGASEFTIDASVLRNTLSVAAYLVRAKLNGAYLPGIAKLVLQ